MCNHMSLKFLKYLFYESLSLLVEESMLLSTILALSCDNKNCLVFSVSISVNSLCSVSDNPSKLLK